MGCGLKAHVADCSGGMSAGCTTDLVVSWYGQWMATYCTAVSLAYDSQLPLPRL